jgi:GNAT superfamily N-acetyltransferase
VELTTVLHRPLDAAAPAVDARRDAPRAVARPIAKRRDGDVGGPVDARLGAQPELSAFMHDFGLVTARSRGCHCFVAELDGRLVATGAVALHGGVALLAGASTLPAWRGRGAQTALLAARLAFAAERGCDLAMMGAAPGSTSQTNAERQGFRVAYTRIKWHRPRGGAGGGP